MDLSLVLFTIVIASYAYYTQFIKIIRRQSSYGISLQAYIISAIAEFVMLIASDVFYVKLIAIFHLVLTSFGIFLIYKYREDLERLTKDFFISLFFSFFMIFGVSQSISSYRNKSFKTNVSIGAYLLFILLNFITLYLETDLFVLTSIIITNILYFYIVVNTYLKNKNFNLVFS